MNDWRRRTATTPNRNQVKRRFGGSWNAAIAAAGLTPKKVGGRGPGKGPQLVRIKPSVANGYTPEEELAYLIEEQRKELRKEHAQAAFSPSLDDPDLGRIVGTSDEWLDRLCDRVDQERELDLIAAEYRPRERLSIIVERTEQEAPVLNLPERELATMGTREWAYVMPDEVAA